MNKKHCGFLLQDRSRPELSPQGSSKFQILQHQVHLWKWTPNKEEDAYARKT